MTLSLSKGGVGLGAALAVLLTLPTPSRAEETGEAYEQSDSFGEESPRNVGSGLIALGYVLTTAGIIVGALSIGSMRGASPNATAEDKKNDKQLFAIAGVSMAAATGGLALQTLGYSSRRDAFVEAGYEPSRGMAGPWILTGLGGAMAAAGVGMAAAGINSRSDGLGIGGALLASGGAFVAVVGTGLARATKYSARGPRSSDGLSIRPWLAPMVTASNFESQMGKGLAAGLAGAF